MFSNVGNYTPASQPNVSYCFHSVEGFSKIGTYRGNNVGGNGTFIYTGFSVKFVLIKRDEAGVGWYLFDTRRSPFNFAYQALQPNSNAVEATYTGDSLDMLSNGFKIRANVNRGSLTVVDTYLYIAFAENPFKYANAR